MNIKKLPKKTVDIVYKKWYNKYKKSIKKEVMKMKNDLVLCYIKNQYNEYISNTKEKDTFTQKEMQHIRKELYKKNIKKEV